jgi:hypothetical protein
MTLVQFFGVKIKLKVEDDIRILVVWFIRYVFRIFIFLIAYHKVLTISKAMLRATRSEKFISSNDLEAV